MKIFNKYYRILDMFLIDQISYDDLYIYLYTNIIECIFIYIYL